jgi:hypothetical protein
MVVVEKAIRGIGLGILGGLVAVALMAGIFRLGAMILATRDRTGRKIK